MAVKIRLARRGRKKMAIYDVVVADARAPRDGRFIEKIGSYNPNTDPASININNDRALKWLMNGAQPTDTVKAMLSYRGVMLKKHLQIGVVKGAITQEQADEKFQAWLENKEKTIASKVDKIQSAKDSVKKAALEAEAAKNQARLDAIKKREDDAAAAVAAAEAEAKAAEAPKEEAKPAEAAEEEAPKEEAPEAEAKPAEAATEEAPKKEEAAKSEAKAADTPKEETPAADKSADSEDKKD
ncbi:30S ribosomal protein S16 [Cyclobacterium plantarum]|uniref:Small ribosomal subunit protein bS16 n=1 Tax=Cyclobacterium plantarum TaxID=2716263 RepID=A0ABX0H9V9_9BACT|nr:30S ribosomal protein S16 [Cyclobacterium plantarum]NHE56977.1 30S ribosomal protein S16 [Cyclobacterium plantarum]